MAGFTGLCLSYEVRANSCAAVPPEDALTTAVPGAPLHLRLLHTAAPLSPHCRPPISQVRSFKPDAQIYAAAEQLTGCSGPELVFIDDKGDNAAAAAALGWRAIHHTSVAGTLRQLAELGLPVVKEA